MTITLQAQFNLFGIIKRQGDWYVACCPPLDVRTQGRTMSEAKKNLFDAAELFIVSCLERGTLDQALKELGFVPMKSKPINVPNAFPLAIPVPFCFQKNATCRA